MTPLALLSEELPPHRVADLLSRNPEDDLLLPLVASWIGDEPPYTRAQALLNAAAIVRKPPTEPPMHPAIESYLDEAMDRRNTIAHQMRTVRDNETLITGFFELASGKGDVVDAYAAYTSIAVAAFTASDNPTLAESITRISNFLGVDPTSHDNPECEVRSFIWNVDGYEFHLHAYLRDDATCRRVQVGTERRKVFRYVEEETPLFQFTC